MGVGVNQGGENVPSVLELKEKEIRGGSVMRMSVGMMRLDRCVCLFPSVCTRAELVLDRRIFSSNLVHKFRAYIFVLLLILSVVSPHLLRTNAVCLYSS